MSGLAPNLLLYIIGIESQLYKIKLDFCRNFFDRKLQKFVKIEKDREQDEQFIGRLYMLSQNLKELNQSSISVEEFLRNNELTDFIQNTIFAGILKKKLELCESEMRLWIAGCSTGQEVYSLAILLKEHIASLNMEQEMDFKIYATDLDYDSVKIAGAGVYPDYAFKSVLPNILNRYFDKKQEFYVVKKK